MQHMRCDAAGWYGWYGWYGFWFLLYLSSLSLSTVLTAAAAADYDDSLFGCAVYAAAANPKKVTEAPLFEGAKI